MPRPKAKTASEIVAKSNEKRGVTPVGVRLDAEEIALLDAAAEAHGGRKAAVMTALRGLMAGDNEKITSAVAVELRKLADQIEPKGKRK